MPTLVDIVTNLVSTMRAVPSAGAVHPRLRSARTPEQIARLVRHAPDGSRGWVLEFLGSKERDGRGFNGEPLELGQVQRLLQFRLQLALSYDDDRASDDRSSTDVFNEMFEDMAAELRRSRSLGFGRSLVEHQLLQAESEFAPVELGQSLGSIHLGRCRLDIDEHPHAFSRPRKGRSHSDREEDLKFPATGKGTLTGDPSDTTVSTESPRFQGR